MNLLMKKEEKMYLLSGILLDDRNHFCGYIYSLAGSLSQSDNLIIKYHDDYQSIYSSENGEKLCQIFNGKTPVKELYINNYRFLASNKNVIPCILKSFKEGFFIKSIWNFSISRFEQFSMKNIEEINNYLCSIL